MILIGAPGDPLTPLPTSLGDQGVAYLAPFGESNVSIEQPDLEKDPTSPRWDRPNFYRFATHRLER